MFMICYKHDLYGSDTLGIEFSTAAAAQLHIDAIQQDPHQFAYEPWVAEASLWVVDENYNFA